MMVCADPSPWMVRPPGAVSNGRGELSKIVPGNENSIVFDPPAAFASSIADRKEPAPESPRLETVKVALQPAAVARTVAKHKKRL